MKKNNKLSRGIALSMSLGTVVGIITDNLGLWLGVGIAMGAGIGSSLSKKKNDDYTS